MEKKKPCSRVVLVLLVIIVAIVTVAAVVPNSESKKPTEKVSPAVEKTNDPAPEELTQEPIADLNGLHVYFNGLEKAPAPAKGYYINLLLENTSDTNYTVQADNLSIGDVSVPFGNYIFSADVSSGKKLNTHIWVVNLDQLGIAEPITSADLSFVLLSDEDLQNGTRSLVTELIHIAE